MAAQRKSASSLLLKLLAIQLPLTGLLVVGFFGFLEFDTRGDQRTDMVHDTVRALDVLEPALTKSVWDIDDVGAQSLVAALGQLPQVQSAMLTAPDGKVLASVGDTALPVTERDLQIERTLSYRGESIGTLDVALTMQPVQAQSEERLIVNGLLLLAILGGMALATIVSSNLVIHRPLTALRRAIEALRQGGDAQPVGWRSGDELGEVIRAFNEVQQAQSNAEQALRQHQDQLEDLVDRRTAELQGQRDLVKAVLDSMTVGVVAFDKDLRLITWNRQFLEIREYPESLAVLGTPFEEFMRYDVARKEFGDGDPERQVQEQVVRAKQFAFHDFERQRPNGAYVDVRGGPIAGGGFVSTYVDVSERKKIEQALQVAVEDSRRQSERFRNLTTNLPAMVFQFTSRSAGDWLLSYVSPYMREAFDFDDVADAEATSLFMERVHPDDRTLVMVAFVQAIETRGYFHRVFRIQKPQGRIMWLEAAARPYEGVNSVLHWDGIMLDISERKRAEDQLMQARDEAEAANRSKSAFLATMSHEIRTPMNGVIGIIDLLRETELTLDQRRMTETARESAFTLLHIINDILDFSKIEAGKLALERIPVSIRDVAESVAENLQPAAESKGLRLSLFIDPAIPSRVLSDQVRLRQILSNLLGNAIKFTEAGTDRRGGVGLRAELVRDAEGALSVRFVIRDSGIGMSADVVAGLFRPFTQADQTTTRRFGGTGLGLTICRDLAEMLNGRITVDSEEGKGSTFTVLLPLEPIPGGPEEEPDLGGVRVIYAVRQDDFVEAIERYVTARGGHASRAISLRDLVQRAAGRDVIILSEAWAGGRYERLVAQLRERASGIRFVIISRDSTARTGLIPPDTVVMHSRPFRRSAFLKSVAMAVGRASPEVDVVMPALMGSGKPAPTVDEARRTGRLILVAEDNATNQEVIRRQLAILGYACEVVDDGVEALDRLDREGYAVLLTDWHMPRMDGLALTAAIRDRERGTDRHLPVVAITADVLQGEAERCLAAGMDDYLPKPLEMERLRAVLSRWMPEALGTPSPSEPSPKMVPVLPPLVVRGDAIELSALTSVFGDDRGTVSEILAEFIESARQIVADIEVGLQAQDSAAIAAAAHKLKSSARAVGAPQVAELAFNLERAGKSQDWPALLAHGNMLPPAFAAVVAFIDKFNHGGPFHGEGAVDDRILRDTFGDDEQTIRDIMADFAESSRANMDGIRQAHAARSADGVAAAAHNLKSSARAIGAHRLADACQALEQSGRTDGWDAINTQVEGLAAIFDAVIEYIKNHERNNS